MRQLTTLAGFAAGIAYLVMAAYATGPGFKLLGVLIGLASIITAHWDLVNNHKGSVNK